MTEGLASHDETFFVGNGWKTKGLQREPSRDYKTFCYLSMVHRDHHY